MSTKDAISQFTVAILPLGDISDWQIKLTKLVLERDFRLNTVILPATKVPSQYFNAERNYYQSHEILGFIFSQLPENAQRIMGITEKNLENSDNQPCHGFADACNKSAVYSVPPFEKKHHRDALSCHLIIHEFGHTLCLKHCVNTDCAMNERQSSDILCTHCQKWADHELKVRPGSAKERFALAEGLFFYRYFHQAIAMYREAIALAPNEALYYRRLSMALKNIGQKKEAAENLMRAVEKSNDKPNLYFNFGLLYLHNQPQDAEDRFAKAIAVAKDPKFTHRLIGQAYQEITHDVERASRHYKEYLRLGGNDPDIVEWLVSRSQMDPP
ncbi:MAG: hypothetical protein G01um101413_33 [Parcubacteria group bacterium Gr01-1014_13]|nr:MAG: hypothetical protein G01um101413_33 [Parcubacteria group bacterium Gr01-1014_13]